MDDRNEVTVPTACTLDTEHARQRVARWRALAERTQPTVTQLGPDTIEVHYPWTPDVIAELTGLAALEAECCIFLTLTVTVHEPGHGAGSQAILTIEPAPGAAPDVAQSLSAVTGLITGRAS